MPAIALKTLDAHSPDGLGLPRVPIDARDLELARHEEFRVEAVQKLVQKIEQQGLHVVPLDGERRRPVRYDLHALGLPPSMHASERRTHASARDREAAWRVSREPRRGMQTHARLGAHTPWMGVM